MKRIGICILFCLLFLVVLFAFSACKKEPESSFENQAESYRIDVTLEGSKLFAEVEIEYTPKGKEEHLPLAFYPLYLKKEDGYKKEEYPQGFQGCEVDIAQVRIGESEAAFELDEERCVIDVKGNFVRGKRLTLYFAYTLRLPPARSHLGYVDEVYYGSCFYPVPCEYKEGYVYLAPLSYTNPYVLPQAEYQVRIVAPNGCVVATAGEWEESERGEKTHAICAKGSMRAFAFTASSSFVRRSSDTALSYLFRSDKDPQKTLSQAEKGVETLSAIYNYSLEGGLQVVRLPFAPQTATFEGLLWIDENANESTLIRALAGEWWSEAVGANEPWLSLSLQYFSALLCALKSGKGEVFQEEAEEYRATLSDRLVAGKNTCVKVDFYEGEEEVRVRGGFIGAYMWCNLYEIYGVKLVECLQKYVRAAAGTIATEQTLFQCLTPTVRTAVQAWLAGKALSCA